MDFPRMCAYIEWANALVPPTPVYWGIQIGLSYDYGSLIDDGKSQARRSGFYWPRWWGEKSLEK